MSLARRIILTLFLVSFSAVLIGCETAAEKIDKTDQWMKENLW